MQGKSLAARRSLAIGAYVALPLLLLVATLWLDSRWYIILSVLLLLCGIVPFFVSFERKKPRAREVVLLAVMSALVMIANLASFMMVPFQAGTAMVLIAGVAFGPEMGFMAGALGRLSVNMFYGQGIWTPWQMFAWGMLGLLAGLVFAAYEAAQIQPHPFRTLLCFISLPVGCVCLGELTLVFCGAYADLAWGIYCFGLIGLLIALVCFKNRLQANRMVLALFGFCLTFFVYGGVMNFSTAVLSGLFDSFSFEGLSIIFLAGIPYDFLHALGVAIFLFCFGEMIIKKFRRIKKKYRIL